MKQTAYIYCRQSAGDEDFSESIEVQRKHCVELAKEKNIEVIDVFSDLNSSGKLYPSGYEELAEKDIIYQNWKNQTSTKKKSRNGLGKLFKALSEKTADYIIVDDYTRFARPLTGSFLDSFLTQILFTYKTKILTCKNGLIDLNSFNDSLITALQNRINDQQIAIQRQKAMDGIKRLKNNGEYQNGLCKVNGFKKGLGKYAIEIDENKIEAVKFAFKSTLEGMPMFEIVRYINKNFPAFDNRFWREGLKKMLKMPYYCGYMYNSDGELIPSKQLENIDVISFSDWNKVQEIIKRRTALHKRTKKHWNPLSGTVICGNCKTPMILHNSKHAKQVYTCVKHSRIEAEPCHTLIAIENNRKEGLGLIQAISPLLVLGALDRLNQNNINNKLLNELEKTEVKVANLKEKQNKLTKMFVDELISEDVLETSLSSLKTEIKELNIKIIELKQQTTICNDEETNRKLFRKVVNGTISHGEFEELYRQVVKKVFIYKDHITISSTYGNIDLPRKHISHFHLLPKFTFGQPKKDSFVLYYYHKDLPMANIYSKNKSILFKNENITIYYVD